jgi:RHS repeat-associated protein
VRTEKTRTTYTYDPLGRRITKHHQNSPLPLAGEQLGERANAQHTIPTTSHTTTHTHFGWDGDTLAFESQYTTHSASPHQINNPSTTHYLFEPGTFVPMAQATQPGRIKLPPTTNIKELIAHNAGQYDIALDPLWADEPPEPEAFQPEQIHYHHCDHLGTPQEMSDHQGHMAWTAKHKAWGQADIALSRAARDAGVKNPFRFQGQYFDEESGLHYNRYRYYDAHAGRFVSKDPLGLAGGNHLHTYAPNPLEWVDPLGLNKKKQKRQCQTKQNSTEPQLPEKIIAQNGGLRLEHYPESVSRNLTRPRFT